MPKNHREKLEANGIKELIVTVDKSSCLLIYPLSVWEELEDKLIALSNNSSDARELQRLYLGHATEVELDGTGRILLTSELRAYAGIERKVYIVGQGKKFELWEEAAWEAQCEKWKSKGDDDQANQSEELARISF